MKRHIAGIDFRVDCPNEEIKKEINTFFKELKRDMSPFGTEFKAYKNVLIFIEKYNKKMKAGDE